LRPGCNQQSTALDVSTVNITPPRRFGARWNWMKDKVWIMKSRNETNYVRLWINDCLARSRDNESGPSWATCICGLLPQSASTIAIQLSMSMVVQNGSRFSLVSTILDYIFELFWPLLTCGMFSFSFYFKTVITI
jgi:hypothetical protein